MSRGERPTLVVAVYQTAHTNHSMRPQTTSSAVDETARVTIRSVIAVDRLTLFVTLNIVIFKRLTLL